MNNDHCEICALDDTEDVIFETDYWRTYLSWSQDRIGRCLTASKQHRRSVLELTEDEWRDWSDVLHRLHPALYKTFGATHINLSCLMNGAFKDDVPQPHVHWWSIPRYDHNIKFDGETFHDENYPSMICAHTESREKLGEPIRRDIITAIRGNLDLAA